MQISLALLLIISCLNPAAAATTYITERLVPFDVPADDLRVVVQKQLSADDFLTNHFSNDHVEVTKLVYRATYNGTGRVVDPPFQSFKHIVTNDSIDVVVTYHAVVHPKLPTKKNYNCSTSLKIYLNYTKEIDLASELTKIEGLKMFVDPSSFRMTYSGKPSASDKQHLDYINKGDASATNLTIYYLLQNQQFSSAITLGYFLENLVSQKLSQTYEPSYNYQYQSLNVTFDMTTARLENIEGGVAHSMRGAIKNFNTPHKFKEIDTAIKVGSGFHTLLTVGFLSNFVEYNIEQNTDWRNYYIDQKRFNTRGFGFRLIDLQFIVDDFSQNYSSQYLNPILFVCNPSALTSLNNGDSEDSFLVGLKWACRGNLQEITPSPAILDFDITVSHSVKVTLNDGNRLAFYIESSELKNWEFREVEGISVIDEQLAALHIDQYLRTIVGFTVGTGFKVKEESTQVVFYENQGLWVG